MSKYISQKGFTIVELLIVIVVIGILAAITIVSFNGVTNKAKVASLQNDTDSAIKSLETYKYTTSTSQLYPATTATSGLKPSGSNVLTYTPYNNQNGYCVQYTNGTASYYAVAGGSAKTGTCTTTTNFIANPDFELNTAGWLGAGNSSVALSTQQAHSGTTSLKVIPATDSQYTGAGFFTATGAPNGSQYTFSAWVYSTTSQVMNFAADSLGINSSPTVGPSWQRLTISGTKTSDNGLYIRAIGTAGIPYYVDDVMFTQGGTAYDYADGNNTNWTWTGTPHASTSTGPIL